MYFYFLNNEKLKNNVQQNGESNNIICSGISKPDDNLKSKNIH